MKLEEFEDLTLGDIAQLAAAEMEPLEVFDRIVGAQTLVIGRAIGMKNLEHHQCCVMPANQKAPSRRRPASEVWAKLVAFAEAHNARNAALGVAG